MKFRHVCIYLISLSILFTCGCSTMVYKDSKAKVIERRMIATGKYTDDQILKARVFKAVPMDSGSAVGIDLLTPDFWTVISEQPAKQVGAAVVDAGMIYGLYKGVEYVYNEVSGNGSNDEESNGGGNESGRDTTVINVNGDGNEVTTSGDDSSTTTGQQ